MSNRKAIEQGKRDVFVAERLGALAVLGRALGKAMTALTCESGDLFVEGGAWCTYRRTDLPRYRRSWRSTGAVKKRGTNILPTQGEHIEPAMEHGARFKRAS
jgi:hypothetical protein